MYMSLLDKDFDGHELSHSLISTGKHLITWKENHTFYFVWTLYQK